MLSTTAVSSEEIANEVGVANNIGDAVCCFDVNTTVESILSSTISAPSSGYVLAIASARVALDHTNGTVSRVLFGVSPDPSALPDVQDIETAVPAGAASGTYRVGITPHGVFEFEVDAGDHTFHLVAQELEGDIRAGDSNLTLLYIPTNYGSVTPNAVASTDSHDTELGSTVPYDDAEQARSLADHQARIERGFAKMRQRMANLEEQLRQSR